MGNGNVTGEKENSKTKSKSAPSTTSNRRKSVDESLFYACTDKARVISDILEERGWSRTKDQNVTNFTIKWCLEHQVDWEKFQEGKQLINNIPGQITFADKVNLWYTIRDYLQKRAQITGNLIQTFLPMTFILDDENEVTEFIRIYKKQNRTWIHKPRYSYAGQGIHVVTLGSDLETFFRVKSIIGNRIQYQTKTPGYLMQEYISRPLLIKGRKFDIRVHWLVAWTKPLLVFYNHNASVIRLSLNLYREYDFDRATHLTNLSVQENHYRYAFSQEATGMTMQQLNQYFNQCFRPFHPKMCQDWVMTVMQDRMQTIIRQVVRASKDKLERRAGHFGLFGCDFLLDENFRLWLLEVNDNPGVGWGNTQVNTTTRPLFEETLNIVLECFEKHKKKRPFLPMNSLQNYQLIYNESDDDDKLHQDEIQVYNERSPTRYSIRDLPSRANAHRILPRLGTSRTSMTTMTVDTSLSTVTEISPNKNLTLIETNDNVENDRTKKSADYFRTKFSYARPTRSFEQLIKGRVKRSLSSNNGFGITRTKRIDLKPILSEKKLDRQKTNVTAMTLPIENICENSENQSTTTV